MEKPRYGYCQCGCGQKTNIATKGCPKKNQIYGEPYRFVRGHHLKLLRREQTNNWKGGRCKTHGYYRIYMPDYPKSDFAGYVLEHVYIAEKVLGKSLPRGAVVHHIDGDPTNNKKPNIVICESISYHRTIHARENALKACGHASWKRCNFCSKYDDLKNLYISPNGKMICHRGCRRIKERQQYKQGTRR